MLHFSVLAQATFNVRVALACVSFYVLRRSCLCKLQELCKNAGIGACRAAIFTVVNQELEVIPCNVSERHIHTSSRLYKPAVSGTARPSPPGIKAGAWQTPCAQHLALLTVNYPVGNDAARRTPRTAFHLTTNLYMFSALLGSLRGFIRSPQVREEGAGVKPCRRGAARCRGRAEGLLPPSPPRVSRAFLASSRIIHPLY